MYKIIALRKHERKREKEIGGMVLILTPLGETGKSCRAGRYSCDQTEAARR